MGNVGEKRGWGCEPRRKRTAPTAVSSWMTASPLSETLLFTMISRSMPSLSMTRLTALRLTQRLRGEQRQLRFTEVQGMVEAHLFVLKIYKQTKKSAS